MSAKVAIHENALNHIEQRLNELALDIQILPYDNSGQFTINGQKQSPGEIDIDYFWLSYQSAAEDDRKIAFQTAVACKSINVLQTFNAGLDDPYYKKISDRGIRICNSSAQAVAISEYVMAQVMSFIHPIDLQREQQQRKIWNRTPFRELSRMQWLIIGFGPIGQQLAEKVKAFGATTSVIRRSTTAGPNTDRVGTLDDLNQFLPEADVIVLACPLNASTRGFADSSFFEAIKDNAVLVNIARGALLNDAALISALDSGRLACAIVDVFHEEPLPQDNPLWSHPGVRLTPHTSFNGDGVPNDIV